MLNAGFKIQDTGYKNQMLDAGCKMQDTGYKVQGARPKSGHFERTF